MSRQKMRQQYNIAGDDIMDLGLSCCCSCCALVQEEKEMVHRKGGQQQAVVVQEVKREGGMEYVAATPADKTQTGATQ